MSAKRLLQVVGLLAVLVIVLGACVPAVAPAPAAPAAPAAKPTEAPPPPAGKTIAGVVFQSDTFMQTVQAGMQAAADKAGVTMIMGNTDTRYPTETFDQAGASAPARGRHEQRHDGAERDHGVAIARKRQRQEHARDES